SLLPITLSSPFMHLISIFSNDPPPTATYTLSLHDALPISAARHVRAGRLRQGDRQPGDRVAQARGADLPRRHDLRPDDRARQVRSEETRLNSSHVAISYAVFCLKKKTTTRIKRQQPITNTP